MVAVKVINSSTIQASLMEKKDQSPNFSSFYNLTDINFTQYFYTITIAVIGTINNREEEIRNVTSAFYNTIETVLSNIDHTAITSTLNQTASSLGDSWYSAKNFTFHHANNALDTAANFTMTYKDSSINYTAQKLDSFWSQNKNSAF